MQMNVKINFDLENYPLQIKTDSEVGSDEEVRVMFYDSQEDLIGGIFLYFTSTPQYFIGYCSSSHVDIPNLPSETDKVWTITFTRTSDVVTLVLHCNEVEVINVVISGTVCKSYWSTYWSRKPASKILFLSEGGTKDTASDYYRRGINIKNSKINHELILPHFFDPKFTLICPTAHHI